MVDMIQGSFADHAGKFKSLQTASELTTARVDDPQLRNKWFWTGDNPLYQRQGDSPILTFTGYPLVLKNLDDAIPQLREGHKFMPSPQELTKAREQALMEIDLSQLRLEGSGEYGFVVINTTDYSALNPEEQKLVSIPFGRGEQLRTNMEMLANAGIRQTRAYVLTPEYVLDSVEGDGGLARLCRLGSFDYSSGFDAGGWDVDGPDGWFRGVLKSAAGAQTSESKLVQEYGTEEFLAYARSHPEEVARAMAPEDLAGLTKIIHTYATTKQ